MRIGTPEHDDYLRELMLAPRQRLTPRTREENAWRDGCALIASTLSGSSSADELREHLRRELGRCPELTSEECSAVLRDAVHSIWVRRGEPQSDAEQLEFDREVDALYAFSALEERERRASPFVRAERTLRRLQRMPGIRAFTGAGAIR